MNKLYKRFWIELNLKEEVEYPWPVFAHYGITAFSYDDAINILKDKIFIGIEVPEVNRCVENVDISDLDQGHVIPNMAPPIYRGIWFPLGYQDNNV